MDNEFEDYAGDDFFNDGTAGDDEEAVLNDVEKEMLMRHESSGLANPKSVRERIDEALEVLANFKSRKDVSMSRSDLIATLAKYDASLPLFIT
jgi:hypothetical protein